MTEAEAALEAQKLLENGARYAEVHEVVDHPGEYCVVSGRIYKGGKEGCVLTQDDPVSRYRLRVKMFDCTDMNATKEREAYRLGLISELALVREPIKKSPRLAR